MAIEIKHNPFERLNHATRRINDLAEQLARDSRVGKPTEDSHGALILEIKVLADEIQSRARIAQYAMEA